MKPRIKGLIALITIMLFASPTSTRAYIPCVQPPSVVKRPLPGVKEVKFVPVKKVAGFGTGYFGPLEKDYKTKAAFIEATHMNGEGKETRSGTKPRIGTIAADIRYYPFGTVIYIPEKNFMGTVEDIGSKIKGKKHIDIFCGYGKKAERIAKSWNNGTPITLVIMQKKRG